MAAVVVVLAVLCGVGLQTTGAITQGIACFLSLRFSLRNCDRTRSTQRRPNKAIMSHTCTRTKGQLVSLCLTTRTIAFHSVGDRKDICAPLLPFAKWRFIPKDRRRRRTTPLDNPPMEADLKLA